MSADDQQQTTGAVDWLLAAQVDDQVDQAGVVDGVDPAGDGSGQKSDPDPSEERAGQEVDDVDDQAGDDQTQDDGRPGRQAAKYRRQLREVQAERDGLAAGLEASRRALAEHLVAGELPKPAALWAAGTNVDDLLDDDGRVDPEKVLAAAGQAREDLGIPRRPRPDRNQASSANSAPARKTATVRNVLDSALYGEEGASRKTGPDQVDAALGSFLEFVNRPK